MTRFQRIHLSIGLTALLALAAAASAARAQTFEQAVRDNMGIGLQLCLGGGRDMAAWANMFRAAGFAERIARTPGNSDTTHYFTAPADTARVELYYGEQPEYCLVSTVHMGVTEAGAVLDQVIPRLFPTYVRLVTPGAVNPATGQPALCVRYEDPSNPIGHVVGVTNAGNSGDCIEDGTSQFYSSYRV